MEKTFGGISSEIPETYDKFDSLEQNYNDYGSTIQYVSKNTYDTYLGADDRRVDCKLVIKLVDWYESTGDDSVKGDVRVSVLLVPLPSSVNSDQLQSIAHSCGIEPSDVTVNDMCDYGLQVPMASETVKGIDGDAPLESGAVKDLLRTASYCLDGIGGLVGFYLDRPANRIGNTGWDFLESFVTGKRNF
jgi:hypothetical protein